MGRDDWSARALVQAEIEEPPDEPLKQASPAALDFRHQEIIRNTLLKRLWPRVQRLRPLLAEHQDRRLELLRQLEGL